jgi:hypothetical protein
VLRIRRQDVPHLHEILAWFVRTHVNVEEAESQSALPPLSRQGEGLGER